MGEASAGKMDRRQFLRAMAGGVAAAVLPHTRAPERPPRDILSTEELDAARVTIHQTPETQLFLRRGVTDIPLFRDAKEGKFDRVVITLVESPKLSYNATMHLPADVQSVWDILHPNTPEEMYKLMVEQDERIVHSTRFNLEAREMYREELRMLKKNPEAAVKKLAEEGAGGQIIFGNDIPKHDWLNKDAVTFLEHHPEAKGKAYIFLAVGGDIAPKPNESFLDPEVLRRYEYPSSFLQDYRFESRVRSDIPTGFVMRHEAAHAEELEQRLKRQHDPNAPYDPTHPEWKTDTIAFERLQEAWAKYKQTGDTTGYPFVFVNKHGITISKKQNPPSQNL